MGFYSTTLNKIFAHKPCGQFWSLLLCHLGKTEVDDEILPVSVILDAVDPVETLWCLCGVDSPDIAIKARAYAVWCAKQVKYAYEKEKTLVDAIEVAARYAVGEATQSELHSANLSVQNIRNIRGDWTVAHAATKPNFWEAASLAAREMRRIEIGKVLKTVPYDQVDETSEELSSWEKLEMREASRNKAWIETTEKVDDLQRSKFIELFLSTTKA